MKLTLNAKECAELMGVSYSTFAVHWREWVKAKRFPEPLFPTGRPLWSRVAVEARVNRAA